MHVKNDPSPRLIQSPRANNAAQPIDPSDFSDTDRERFWGRISIAGPDECWDWVGPLCRGYGMFGVRGRQLRSNRVALVLGTGEVLPAGPWVLHSCDRRCCCNPAHLRAGTPAENMRDMDERGRRVTNSQSGPGTRNPHHRISEAQVIEIRVRAANGETSHAIGASVGLSDSAVRLIVRRERWSHVLEPLAVKS